MVFKWNGNAWYFHSTVDSADYWPDWLLAPRTTYIMVCPD